MKNITMSRSARAGEQLLRTPPPLPDESLMGYILRLSELNYYDAPRWILDLAGLKMDSLRNGWRRLCDDHIDFTLFRQITKLSEEEVNEMKHKITRDLDYEDFDAQWDIPVSSLRFKQPMVCSNCLRENSYCRKFWDLPVVTVCPQHHSLLLDICPNCRERITWSRKGVSWCDCGYDWREVRSTELPPAQRRAIGILMHSCRVFENEQAAICASTAPFEQLGFGDLSRVMLCLARFVSVGETGMDPLMMENNLLHQALEQVVAILDDWPEEFHRLCIRHLDRYSGRDLALQLDRLADRPSLMFLRIATEEHRINAIRPSFSAYGLWASRRFIPVEEAGRRMGMSREWVNFFVSTGRLRSAASASNPQTTLIDVKSMENLFKERRRMITTRTAAAELGITSKELFDLIAYGHMKIAGEPQIDGCPETGLEAKALLEAKAVLDLYRRIERMSSPTLETALGLLLENGSSELMSFNDVREQLQEKNFNLGRWLRGVFDGELTPFKLHPMLEYSVGSIRLTQFAFRRDQIQQYFALDSMGQSPIPTKAE
jgi:hypothetical protein